MVPVCLLWWLCSLRSLLKMFFSGSIETDISLTINTEVSKYLASMLFHSFIPNVLRQVIQDQLILWFTLRRVLLKSHWYTEMFCLKCVLARISIHFISALVKNMMNRFNKRIWYAVIDLKGFAQFCFDATVVELLASQHLYNGSFLPSR